MSYTQRDALEKPNRPAWHSLFLFGLLFFAAGGGITSFMGIRPLILLDRARAWAETPAVIQEIDLRRHRARKGGTTYSLDILYQYEFSGQTHTSERFSFYSGSDSANYHRENYRRYKPFVTSKEPVTCWVNPADPSEAVIDRAPRFEMVAFSSLFSLTFGLAGLGIMLGALASRRAAHDPGARSIPLKVTPLYVLAGLAAATLAYTAFLFWKLLPFMPWPWHTYLIALPAAILCALALNRYAYGKAFGGARLDMAAAATVGDTLSGSVHIPRPVEGELTVTLRCQKQVTTGSGKHRHVSTTTLWETVATVFAVTDGMTTTVPVRFAIPPDQPAATDPAANPSVTWQLRAKVNRRTLAFDIPVRANPASPAPP
ncbi:MAG: DUF3592 domain-containing protein [Kiritimatiellaeota bacterium]|nr:DUF3592 domain-containing protein [Kiritimatiellota bacterium]